MTFVQAIRHDLREALRQEKTNYDVKITMKFILPMPPSINNTYGISRRGQMFKKNFVVAWEEEAGYEIIKQKRGQTAVEPTGPVKISVVWFYKRERDIDASIKVLLDLFQKQQVYLNDKQVKDLHLKMFQDKENPRVEVDIEEYELK